MHIFSGWGWQKSFYRKHFEYGTVSCAGSRAAAGQLGAKACKETHPETPKHVRLAAIRLAELETTGALVLNSIARRARSRFT